MTESTDKQLLDKALAGEQQLDEYLKGDSSVSRQYRQLHSAEVPAELDQLVLRQAEDAVKNRPAHGRPAWVRWTAPLAVAASTVLVLSIVIQTGVRDETATQRAPQPTMQAQQRERAESKAEERQAGESVTDESTADESAADESAADERVIAEQAAPVSGFVPPAEVAPEPATDSQVEDYAQPQYTAPAAPPPPKLDTPSPRAMRSEAPQAVAQDRSPPPPAAAPVTIMPARSVSRAAEDAARVLQASSIEESARKQSAGVANQAVREEERSLAETAYSRQISAPISAPRAYTDPEVWLKDIRELRKENKQEQADREWRRFRAAFPKYEVAETDLAREAKK